MDKIEKKIEKSRWKAKAIQERSRAWDELNRRLVAKKTRGAAMALEEEILVEEANGREGEDMELGDSAVDDVNDLDVEDTPQENSIKVTTSTEGAVGK